MNPVRYLAQLARKRGGRLATFDRGLAQLHSDVVHLVPIVRSRTRPSHRSCAWVPATLKATTGCVIGGHGLP